MASIHINLSHEVTMFRLAITCTSLVPRPFFATQGKTGLVNCLFHSHSLRWNVGSPIRLLCEDDVLHGNNGDQKSWAIEAVCKRPGYAGLKPDHKKAVRSFRMCWELVKNCEWTVLNASKMIQSLSLKEVFLSRVVVSWQSEPPLRAVKTGPL